MRYSLLPRVVSLLAVTALGAARAAETELPRSTPEAEGVEAAQVLALVDALDHRIDSVHSLMLLRHGRVVAEGWWAPYSANDVHLLYSVTKSFVSTATGLAVAEGRLKVSDPVLSFFPDLAPAHPSPNLQAMRIHDLLTMTTGHDHATMGDLRSLKGGWVKAFLATDVPFKPGIHFVYDSGGVYVLAAILQRVTGTTVDAYLQSRLFGPLGIDRHPWGMSPEGVDLGDGGLSLRTEDLAKFGQLYLQKGMWHNRRLVPEKWVEAASSRQTSNGSDPDSNWEHGYGYLIWLNKGDGYRADGAEGQYCFVLPDYDAVLAITSGTSDLAGVMNTVWEFLPAAFHYVALAPNPAADAALARRLASLALAGPGGEAHAPLEREVSGKTYALEANERGLKSVALDFSGPNPILTIEDAGGRHAIACGLGRWVRGRSDFYPHVSDMYDQAEQGIAASGAWSAPDAFTVKLCFDETPYVVTLRFKLADGRLELDFDNPLRWEANLRHLRIRGVQAG